ncbi:hypothetical protein ADUPG1_011957, partial [Aduncisulcus paluster]
MRAEAKSAAVFGVFFWIFFHILITLLPMLSSSMQIYLFNDAFFIDENYPEKAYIDLQNKHSTSRTITYFSSIILNIIFYIRICGSDPGYLNTLEDEEDSVFCASQDQDKRCEEEHILENPFEMERVPTLSHSCSPKTSPYQSPRPPILNSSDSHDTVHHEDILSHSEHEGGEDVIQIRSPIVQDPSSFPATSSKPHNGDGSRDYKTDSVTVDATGAPHLLMRICKYCPSSAAPRPCRSHHCFHCNRCV